MVEFSSNYWMILAVVLCLMQVCQSFQEVYPVRDSSINDSRTDLYIGLIMAFGYNNTFNSSGTVPAIQLALDMINDNPHILPGYKLNYILTDSQVVTYSSGRLTDACWLLDDD
jgi:hypothetical protein